MRHRKLNSWIAVALLLAAVPAAADAVIGRGIDAFTTTANGRTHYDFAANPIPAGFLCPGSPAFTGRVLLRGLPLETTVPGALRGADTVLERLDDAVFDTEGVAEIRLRFRALSLVSVEPLQTPCGAFHVHAALDGEQPATAMQIVRNHPEGGSFTAPLEALVRLRFVPIGQRTTRVLELPGHVVFPPVEIPWSFAPGDGVRPIGSVVVDTDGDLRPDAHLAGTSNFAPGWPPAGVAQPNHACRLCEPETCHTEGGEQHCTGPIYACTPAACP